MALRWTPGALSSLGAIVAYIEKDSAARAKSFARDIQAKTNSLIHFPALGRPGRVQGTRELLVHPNYIVAYRVRGDLVEILRVRHVARRWPRRL